MVGVPAYSHPLVFLLLPEFEKEEGVPQKRKCVGER